MLLFHDICPLAASREQIEAAEEAIESYDAQSAMW